MHILGTDQTDSSPSLTRKELLSALDAQIKFKMDERQSAGWTRWAVWGALATLTWLATDLFSRPELSLARTTLLAIGLFAVCRLLEMVIAIFSPSARASLAPTRFRIFADVISSARLELLAAVAGYGLIIFALAWFSFHHLLLVWIYVVAATLFNAVIFAYSLLPLAIPTKPQRRVFLENLPSFIAIGVLLGALAQVWLELGQFSPGINLPDVRLAAILIAIAYLLNWLAADTTATPLLDHLKNIRQDLAFGRITLAEAARHSELALTGLKLAEALHLPISTALARAEELQAVLAGLKELTGEATSLVSALRENELAGPEVAGQSAQLIRLLDRLDQELTDVAAKKSALEKAVAKLVISSQIIVMFSPESKQEIQSITAKVASAIVAARDEEAIFTKQIAALKNAANELTKKGGSHWQALKIEQ